MPDMKKAFIAAIACLSCACATIDGPDQYRARGARLGGTGGALMLGGTVSAVTAGILAAEHDEGDDSALPIGAGVAAVTQLGLGTALLLFSHWDFEKAHVQHQTELEELRAQIKLIQTSTISDRVSP